MITVCRTHRARVPQSALASLWCALLVIMPASAVSQQVSQLEIHKKLEGIDQQGRTRVEIYLPLDLEGLDLDDPIDKDATRVTSFAGDQGFDLLQQHRKVQQSNVDRGYDWITALRFVGVADRRNNRDVKLSITSSAAPSPAASRLTLAANIVFNYADAAARSSVVVEQFPLPEHSGRSTRLDSDIGTVSLEMVGSSQLNDMEWRRMTVSVPGISILDVEVIGGDDSDSLPIQFADASAGEFVIRDGRELTNVGLKPASAWQFISRVATSGFVDSDF